MKLIFFFFYYEVAGIMREMTELYEHESSPNLQLKGFRVQAPLVRLSL